MTWRLASVIVPGMQQTWKIYDNTGEGSGQWSVVRSYWANLSKWRKPSLATKISAEIVALYATCMRRLAATDFVTARVMVKARPTRNTTSTGAQARPN